MAQRATRWSPDTCECIIDLEYDDSIPLEDRAFTPVPVRRCPVHAAATAEEVWTENRSKNSAIRTLSEAVQGLTPDSISWRWGADRKLILQVKAAGGGRSAALAAALPAVRRVRADVAIEETQ